METDLCDVDDAVLLARWIDQRDEHLFEEIHRRYACLVRSVGCRVGSPDPDELTQSVFLLLANRPEAVGDATRLSGWLIGVARKMAANQRRGMRRDLRLDEVADLAQEPRDQPGDAWSDLLPHLGRALQQLSSGRRDAVIQVYLEGRSQAEAAQNLGCTVSAIRVRLSEGLHLLRDQLNRRGVAYSPAVSLGIILHHGMAKASGMTIGGNSTALWTVKSWWSGLGMGGKIGLTGAGAMAVSLGCATVIAITRPDSSSDESVPPEPVTAPLAPSSTADPDSSVAHQVTVEEQPHGKAPTTNLKALTPTRKPDHPVSRRATLDYDGDPWVWKGHHGRWVWKPGQFRPTHDGGKTQYWWHWDS